MSEQHASLEPYGWDAYFEAVWAAHAGEGDLVGRIVAEYSGAFVVRGAGGESEARVSGRLRHDSAGDAALLPAVGDWVLHVVPEGGDGLGHIRQVLPRRTALSRRAAGADASEQVIASNVDVVFVVSTLGRDLNPRRIERYLMAVWDGGATPVLVLTKTDLEEDVEDALRAVAPVAEHVDVHTVSAVTGDGLFELDRHLLPGKTVALVGSSGVGKSTLVNHWLGGDVQDVREVRTDGKGRHTTTHRQLFLLPGGSLVIDTPGMRELGLWESGDGLQEAFPDVESLANSCRFRDCAHESEPGCAVILAVEEGRLPSERLEAYRKLSGEIERLAEQREAQGRREARRRDRRQAREFRRTPKRRRD